MNRSPLTRGTTKKLAGNSISVERQLAHLEQQQKLMGAVYVRRPGDRVSIVYAEVASHGAAHN